MTILVTEPDGQMHCAERVPHRETGEEARLRDLIHDRPVILPIETLEPGAGRVFTIAKEVRLPGAGDIDVLLMTEHGRLIVVECKLWRNPQARREVVGQVLDYARELARYGYEDLQRVISARTGRRGNVLFDLARESGSQLDEAAFVDRISRDLAAGRFLLIIAGDGITEGTQRITEYLADQPGLAFDLALLEVAEYRMEDAATGQPRQIIHPRILARTHVIERHVIRSEVDGLVIAPAPREAEASFDRQPSEAHLGWSEFVDRFVSELQLDDPAQLLPRRAGLNSMRLPLPGDVWINLWRSGPQSQIGAQIKFADPDTRQLYAGLLSERDEIEQEFATSGLSPLEWRTDKNMILLTHEAPQPWSENTEAGQRQWFANAANRFVNSFRPRLARMADDSGCVYFSTSE